MKTHFKLWLLVLFVSIFGFGQMVQPVNAVEPSEMLKDPVLEKRARDISKGLRCLVCQNQTIDDSNAGLAKDLRILVRKRLLAGDSNQQVVDFVVDRYGDYVLLEPPFKMTTFLLWLSPALIAALALLLGYKFYRNRPLNTANDTEARALSQEEEQKFKATLEGFTEQDQK